MYISFVSELSDVFSDWRDTQYTAIGWQHPPHGLMIGAEAGLVDVGVHGPYHLLLTPRAARLPELCLFVDLAAEHPGGTDVVTLRVFCDLRVRVESGGQG